MSINISRVAIGTALFLVPFFSIAQTKSAGFKLNPSLGFMRSPGLKQAAATIESNSNGSIQEYDVRAKAGFQFGIGGFFQYEVNERFALLTDPSFNYFRSKITQNYIAQEQINNGTGMQHNKRSAAQIKYFYVNIPIMVKYEVLAYQKIFVSGGVSVNINMKPKIHSDEDSVTNYFQNDEIYRTEVKNTNTNATLDKFSPIGLNLTAGIGKSFLLGKYYNLDIELRYQFPLLSSAMYTTDPAFQSATALNNVFTQSGAEYTESISGKSKFRTSVISLSIRYILWSK